MKPHTLNFLQHLSALPWFRMIGKPDLPRSVLAVTDWTEALEYVQSEEHKPVQMDAANEISEFLWKTSPKLFQGWNGMVAELKPLVTNLAVAKTNFWRGLISGVDSIEASIQWNVIHAAIESEVGAPSHFYRDLCRWYELGHFPCGWNGGLHDGAPIVF